MAYISGKNIGRSEVENLDAKDFEGQDVLSLLDWPREKIEYVFRVAEKMEPIVRSRSRSQLLSDKILAAVFYTPSTRTRCSFESAMLRLGGGVTGWESGASTRARGSDIYTKGKKGESNKDTAIMLEHYADAIAMRHDEEGAAREFAEWAKIPVLNGGDGYGPTSEHPTQALLDLYTIKKEQGRIDGLSFLHVGDNQRTRGGHSLNFGLSKFDGVKVYICCPPELKLRPLEYEPLDELGLDYEYVDRIEDVLTEVDVVEISTPLVPEEVRGDYTLTAAKLEGVKDNFIVMHQLPRGDSIDTDIDDTKYAKFFKQAWYGVPIRMALLSLVFGREP
jgi:aspartate carbamoyltransferase catalytic subunit